MLAGLVLALETIVHYTVNPGDDSHIKAFGISFDAASPYIWATSAVLLVGGFLVARRSWVRVRDAWDKAGAVPREEDVAA
jgi:branched-chain amino acid transport system permease protein